MIISSDFDTVARLYRQVIIWAITEEWYMEDTQFTVLILLDVKNTFVSLPWNVIMLSLRDKGISPYLRRQV